MHKILKYALKTKNISFKLTNVEIHKNMHLVAYLIINVVKLYSVLTEHTLIKQKKINTLMHKRLHSNNKHYYIDLNIVEYCKGRVLAYSVLYFYAAAVT